jgi:hypothetical protein
MRKSNVLLPALSSLVLLVSADYALAEDYTLCEGLYALCTSAKCSPVEGEEGTVACSCEVRDGYSAGRDNCKRTDDTRAGAVIQSRYYPVRSLSICDNDRQWADCLGKRCTIDKNDPGKATCFCTTEKNKGPYVIVGDAYTPRTCTTGIISSATVTGNKGITEFLKSTGKLEPFAVKVLNETQSDRKMQPTGGKMTE